METVFGTTKLCFLWIFVTLATLHPCVCVGPCRPQVVDGGTASDVEGSCEYIEYAVVESRQAVVLQLEGWARS